MRPRARRAATTRGIGAVEMVLLPSLLDRHLEQQPLHDAGRDRVQHDRADDLGDAALDLEVCRDAGPQPTGDHRDDEGQQYVERSGEPGLAREERSGEGGDAVLPVDTDVEEVHPEADGDGDRGEVVDGGAVDDLHELARPRPRQDRLPDLDDRVTEGEQDRRRDEEGDEQGEQRRREAEQGLARVEGAHRLSSTSPVWRVGGTRGRSASRSRCQRPACQRPEVSGRRVSGRVSTAGVPSRSRRRALRWRRRRSWPRRGPRRSPCRGRRCP